MATTNDHRDTVALGVGWLRAGATERCNFHWRRPAVYSYFGTPLCESCSRTHGLPEPDGGDAGHRHHAA
jgi:hypothetical protein